MTPSQGSAHRGRPPRLRGEPEVAKAYQFHSGALGFGKMPAAMFLRRRLREDLPVLEPFLDLTLPPRYGAYDVEFRDLDDAFGLVLHGIFAKHAAEACMRDHSDGRGRRMPLPWRLAVVTWIGHLD